MRQILLAGLGAGLFLGAAALVAAQAADSAKPAPARQCFYPSDIGNWTAVDRQTVNIRVGVRDVYQLKLMNTCPEIDFKQSLGFDTRGSNTVCSGIDINIISRVAGHPWTCPVTSITKLTPEQVAALPKKEKP